MQWRSESYFIVSWNKLYWHLRGGNIKSFFILFILLPLTDENQNYSKDQGGDSLLGFQSFSGKDKLVLLRLQKKWCILLWCLKGGWPPEAEEHDDVHDDDEEGRDGEGGDKEADVESSEIVVCLVEATERI